MKTWDVIVVGGGFAGIMAARELSTAGLSVLLLEGRDRLGGRTACREFAGTDSMIELGGTYLDHGQPHVQREAARYGIELVYPPEPERFVWHLNGLRKEGGFPVPWEEAVGAETALAAIRAAAGRIRPEQPHFEQGIEDIDVSVEEFVARLPVGPVTRDFIHSWSSLYTGTEPAASSSLYALHGMSVLGGSPVALAPSLKLDKGTSRLVAGIASDFSGEVRLSTHVSTISQDGEGVTVQTSGGSSFRADHAVVALPVNVLNAVTFDPPLSASKQQLAKEGFAAHGFKFFALVENVPEVVQAVGWATRGGVTWLSTDQWIGDRNLLVGFAHPCEGFSPFNVSDIQKAIGDYFPEARVIAVDGFDWNEDQYSQGTWMVPRPGQMTALTAAHDLDEERLHFAGADLSLRWMSWIEGALETGYEAAQRLLERRSREDG